MQPDIRTNHPRPNRGPRLRPLAALLPAAFLLLACSTSPAGPESLDVEPRLIGGYTASADTLILRRPIDTSWGCSSSEPGRASMTVFEPKPDTSRFRITGNRMEMLREEVWILSSDAAALVIRWRSDWQRVAGGPGLEGRWTFRTYAYEPVSGTLDSTLKERADRMARMVTVESRFVTTEMEFSRDSMWQRQDGDFAGLFVAEWNGELLDGTPDSAGYDVEVKAVDPRTVRFRGRRTGETVILEFIGPELTKRYSSDNPDHPPFYPAEAFKRCDFGWIEEFLAANRHPAVPAKKGRPDPNTCLPSLENSRKYPFSGSFQGFPLNRPESLLN